MADEAKPPTPPEEAKEEPAPTFPGVKGCTIPYELSDMLIEAGKKGDKASILTLCKMAVPAWADVEFGDFVMEPLGGGFSGNVPIKCAAEGKPMLALKINTGGDGEDGLVENAFKNLSKAGVVPKVYCLGDPNLAGLEVYEFVQGQCAGSLLGKHGPEWVVNADDAKSFGTEIAKFHAAPAEWYEKYKDSVKGQWEAWFDTPCDQATEFKGKYGDYAYMTALWGNKFAGMGKNAGTLTTVANALTPMIYDLLPQDTLMGRMVVGHGDAHGCNTMHRTADGHGDFVFVDLDFVGLFPAAIDVMGTLLASSSASIFGFFFAGKALGDHPTLAQRQLVAKAYIDTLGEGVTSKYKRTSVDEVVFDMEVGCVMRWLWLIHIMTPFGFNNAPKCTGWAAALWSKCGIDILTKAATDDALKKEVLEKGVTIIVRDAILAKEYDPLNMTPEEFASIWTLYGEGGLACPGGPFPNDAPPAAESEDKKATESDNNFRAATLEFFKNTGADIDAAFKEFDLDGDGSINMMELIAGATKCGVGFKTMAEAEAKFKELDADSDGKISLEEFKAFLEAEEKAAELEDNPMEA